MFGLRMPELLIILAVVVVLFGGAKLPELGKGLGEGMKSFRKAMKEARSDDDETPAKTS
ncbi:MAG TPA: twin-arginine translocase TatA/TatE family subunit [Anaeromyxobacteraceae bacterium]|nr:twin-arginine translocase TatA/TatE family subunit [Anaeromyxobacteraceae bacterium]